ncbi:hypothetical protein ALC62_10909 [Cyphomyrmex costatus]|uniref:Uncharacterized protein n=1 Tax=Cyphomyrmex costatus TaxID=456900 RepID=A0A151ID96_9HYME|nr:hypothetical protein ALC62_10909 [Cyphomyrmex costatus]
MRCGLLHLLLIVGERGRRSFSSDLDASLITAPVRRSPSTFNLRTEKLIEVNLPLLFRPLMRKYVKILLKLPHNKSFYVIFHPFETPKGGAHQITCDVLKVAAKFSRNNMLLSCCRTGLFPMRQILSTEYLLSAGPLLFHTIASCREKANRYVGILRRENSLSISTPHHFNSHFFLSNLKISFHELKRIFFNKKNISSKDIKRSLYLSFDLSVPSGFTSDLGTCAISILSGRRVENVALPLYGNYNVQLA